MELSRSSPSVARLFNENRHNYSISVHGCDHTRAEFGTSDRAWLHAKAKRALERMDNHESKTGVRYDRVMVFPQGVFSEAGMSVLKQTDFIATVNNDVVSADPHRPSVTIAEVWDTAVMRYSTFPLFTRRYPWEGVENFAFDILLGKPAIIVIHHEYCSDGCERLTKFIDSLNGLNSPLTWRSLGEVVTRSCRQREVSPDLMEIEIYGTELRVKNRSAERMRHLIRRRESEPAGIKEICSETESITWNSTEASIEFSIELDPGESRMIEIRFHDLIRNGRHKDNISYRAKAALRRYLCEIRDNYITPAKFTFARSR